LRKIFFQKTFVCSLSKHVVTALSVPLVHYMYRQKNKAEGDRD